MTKKKPVEVVVNDDGEVVEGGFAAAHDDGDIDGATTELTVLDHEPTVIDARALAVHEQIMDLRATIENNYWEMSRLLSNVYQDGLFVKLGFSSWGEYVTKKLDMKLRKAQYLIGIYDWFSKMSPQIQDWIKSLGWSKAKELVGIVTEANAADWKRKLENKSVTELVALVEAASEEDEPAGDTTEPAGESDSEDEKPTVLKFSLFAAQRDNIELALKKAKKQAESDKDGHALDLICTEFLATGTDVDSKEDHLGKIERLYGIKLVAYDVEKDVVVYGADFLDTLAK